jgi:hypothetical protein
MATGALVMLKLDQPLYTFDSIDRKSAFEAARQEASRLNDEAERLVRAGYSIQQLTIYERNGQRWVGTKPGVIEE